MIRIIYTKYFKDFLEQFEPDRQELIKKILIDYCDGAIALILGFILVVTNK